MDKLRFWMTRHRITQEELADALDVHPTAVSQWVCGRTRPSTANLMKLARLTKLDLRVLVRDAGITIH